MAGSRKKPQGMSGPIKLGGGGTAWEVIQFPDEKAAREQMIADIFASAFEQWVAGQSEPSIAPIQSVEQNAEYDLDFTIGTALGKKLLELAEFAPLNTHGPKFENAPPSLHPSEKSKLALELVHDKSDHQGGNDRVLLLYATEHGFWLDPITIEIMRRRLADAPPRFDRVFYLSIHDPKTGSLSEIYPGSPHHMFGEHSDDKLAGMNVIMPHPTEMEGRQAWECSGSIRYGNGMSPIRIKIDMPATLKIRGA